MTLIKINMHPFECNLSRNISNTSKSVPWDIQTLRSWFKEIPGCASFFFWTHFSVCLFLTNFEVFGYIYVIAWLVVAIIPRVIFQNFPKYHVQVMLQFVYHRSREISGNAQETFISLRLKKTITGVCIRNNLFTSMKKKDRQFFVLFSFSGNFAAIFF